MTHECRFCLLVARKDDYFHVVCQGDVSLGGILRGWKELAERCFREDVHKIICQPHAPGPAEFLDVYQFGLSFREIAWPPGMRIAVVCGADDLARYQVAEALVSNLRGPKSGIFTEVAEARNWLLERP